MKDIILKTGTHINIVTSKATQRGAVSGTSLEKFVTTLLKNPTCCAKYVTLTKGVVAQSGSISSAVTLNQPAGEITTVSTTLSTGTLYSFTFNNNYIKADSVIMVSVNDTTGSGMLVAQVDGIVAGSCTIGLGAIVANTGTVTIAFAIF